MEKMDINQLAYFIGEELRKRRDKDYDVETHNNLATAYPEQTDLIHNELQKVPSAFTVEYRLNNISSHKDFPLLKDKYIELYIIPRVSGDIPRKTAEEIGML